MQIYETNMVSDIHKLHLMNLIELQHVNFKHTEVRDVLQKDPNGFLFETLLSL